MLKYVNFIIMIFLVNILPSLRNLSKINLMVLQFQHKVIEFRKNTPPICRENGGDWRELVQSLRQ